MTSLLSTSNHLVGNASNHHFTQHNTHTQNSHRLHSQSLSAQHHCSNNDQLQYVGLSPPLNDNDNCSNRTPNGDESNTRGSISRVPQYILSDVMFVEELGEGAFGMNFNIQQSINNFIFPSLGKN